MKIQIQLFFAAAVSTTSSFVLAANEEEKISALQWSHIQK